MKQWFQRMGMRFAQFMYGRYGNDRLNTVILIAALVCLFLAYIPYLSFFSLISLGLLIWSNFRCFSRNINKRRKELEWFTGIGQRMKRKSELRKKIRSEKDTHCYFKCPSCKAMLRVPKGKGEIDVTCPKCRAVTVKKT